MLEFFITYKPLFIILHALGAAGGLGAVFITDVLFMDFLHDKKISEKETQILKTMSYFVWAMIVFLVCTGIALYLSGPMEYLNKSKFIVKMSIFSIITLNGAILHLYITPYLKKISFDGSRSKLTWQKRVAFASGGISFVSWIIVFLLGSIRSIPFSTKTALTLYIAFIIVVILGSQIYLHIKEKSFNKIKM